jgi:hypothetical protein
MLITPLRGVELPVVRTGDEVYQPRGTRSWRRVPLDPDGAAAVLRADEQPLRTRLAHRQQQQDVACAEIFGDPVAVAALVDRLVHRAEVHVLKGDSYRLRSASTDAVGTKTSG